MLDNNLVHYRANAPERRLYRREKSTFQLRFEGSNQRDLRQRGRLLRSDPVEQGLWLRRGGFIWIIYKCDATVGEVAICRRSPSARAPTDSRMLNRCVDFLIWRCAAAVLCGHQSVLPQSSAQVVARDFRCWHKEGSNLEHRNAMDNIDGARLHPLGHPPHYRNRYVRCILHRNRCAGDACP